MTPKDENHSQQRKKLRSGLNAFYFGPLWPKPRIPPIHALDSPPLDFAKERGAIASRGKGLWVWMGRTLTRC